MKIAHLVFSRLKLLCSPPTPPLPPFSSAPLACGIGGAHCRSHIQARLGEGESDGGPEAGATDRRRGSGGRHLFPLPPLPLRLPPSSRPARMWDRRRLTPLPRRAASPSPQIYSCGFDNIVYILYCLQT